ncbi:anthranilate synthase component I [Nitratiruptor sp. YY08-26]|uniref:anthranilate synthase component I family protein n=1 Tax=unclassified Nitratiruptor TaxID=2624044 RepID=UPI0019157B26|nr:MULTISPECIES: anthranilate synthase component I family protein [unclassified Nitratiruptor]BCD61929.1 anthranilate synthase component I [Nitratiruptor sp. YY08-13]BCD65864.1 anthranilate synthase component I [Nitratiruptor sp. YY08-26]
MIFYRQFMLDEFTPIALYEKAKDFFKNEKSYLFESVVNTSDGNFSYIICGEKEAIWSENGKSFYKNSEGDIEEVESNPLLFMKRYYKNIDFAQYKKISKELSVGFIDGFIGYIGYDMVQEFEPVLKKYMQNLKDELHTPDFYMLRPKLIIAYSHKNSTLTLITSTKEIEEQIFPPIESAIKDSYQYTPLKKAKLLGEATFAHSKEKFFAMVEKSKQMIRSGDVFQIVISNRLKQKAVVDRFSFYRKLRSLNPSPYLFLLEFEDFAIAGSSPEVMVRLTDREILLRPIAGTRKRGNTAKRDKELEIEMLNDPKEVAEHVMLIDLGRNDVGRVAKAGTVKVPEIMRIERYSHVMHMVSDVVGILDEKYDMFDLFMATFTAGTMTGAPKIRAMELIAEFEGLKRGYYSGSIGYFGFNGDMDSAITIRTALLKENEVIFQAGAGIVADSKPELEYLEVNNKLGALKKALEELAQ